MQATALTNHKIIIHQGFEIIKKQKKNKNDELLQIFECSDRITQGHYSTKYDRQKGLL